MGKKGKSKLTKAEIEKRAQQSDEANELINQWNAFWNEYTKNPYTTSLPESLERRKIQSLHDRIGKVKSVGGLGYTDGELGRYRSALADILNKGLPLFDIQRKIIKRINDGEIDVYDAGDEYFAALDTFNSDKDEKKQLHPPKNEFVRMLNNVGHDGTNNEPHTEEEEHIEVITTPRHPELDIRSDDDEPDEYIKEMARKYKEKSDDGYYYGHEEEDVAEPTPEEDVAEPTPEEDTGAVVPVDDKGGEVLPKKEAIKKTSEIINDFMEKNKTMIESMADLSQIIPMIDEGTYRTLEHTLSETLKDAKDDAGEKLFGDAGSVINFLRRLRDKNKKKYKLPVNLEKAVKREQNLTTRELTPMFRRSVLHNTVARYFYNE